MRSLFAGIIGCSALLQAQANECQIPLAGQQFDSDWQISNIQFDRRDIFELDKKHSVWFHRFANDYHVVTHEATLREDLLFQEGQPYQAAVIAETERLLRSRRYLRHAEIEVSRYCPANKQVELTVRTFDNWSLLPRISLGHSGGETKSNLGLAEDNLWGTGNQAQVEYFKDSERDGYRLQFHSPNISATHWQTTLQYADTSDGESYRFNLARPFYRLSSERAYNADLFSEIKDISEYARGDVFNEYRSKQKYAELSTGWSVWPKAGLVQHISVGLTKDRHSFSLNSDSTIGAPPDHDTSMLWLSWDLLASDYQELRNFFLWNRVEDINFGWQAQVKLGRVMPSLGADNDGWHLQASLQKNIALSDEHWLVNRFSYRQLKLQSEQEQQLFQTDIQYIRHLSQQQVLQTQLKWSVGKNLYRDQRIDIGGDAGMRAFPLYYQTGDKALVASAEYRYITNWHVYQLLDVAIAAFVDVGRAWDNPERPPGPDDGKTLSGYGVGLRLLPSHSSRGSVISIDLARPVSDNPDLQGWRWQLIAKRPF